MKRKRAEVSFNEPESDQLQATPTRSSGRIRTAPVKDYDDVITVDSPLKKSRGDIRTPTKTSKEVVTPTRRTKNALTPSAVTNADRSARRKSARVLINQAANGDEEDSQDELLAKRIYGEDDEDEEDAGDGAGEDVIEDLPGDDGLLLETPTKRKPGRPKGWKKPPTPSPPPDLPAYEHYFFQNRPGGSKASDNTLPASALISHEDFFTTTTAWKNPHEPSLDFLHALHSQSFDQWTFELDQGFSICAHGYGSKRELLLDFAQHLSSKSPERKIIIINGHNSNLTTRGMLATIASTIPSLASSDKKLGSQPHDMLTTILAALSAHPPARDANTTLILHSIDGPSLRRLAAQSILARLASNPHISLVCSANTLNFPVLWDATLRIDFNFVYHDCTTFAPYDVEIYTGSAGGVVDEVNNLLGRSGRKMQGREGVMFVLKSLTRNARGLFGMLVAELLSMDDDGGVGGVATMDAVGNADLDRSHEEDGDAAEEDGFEDAVTPANASGTNKRRREVHGGLNAMIEYRTLYQKAVEQFIATNEMSFRGLLKEFHDHEMILSRKDSMGVEVLGVPFRREELEMLLEELIGDI